MTKVLFFCQSYFSQYGGVYNIRNRVKIMCSLGYDVAVVTRSISQSSENPMLLVANEEIYFENDHFERNIRKYLNFRSYLRLVKTNRKIIRLVQEYCPDIIMVHGERPHQIYLKLQHFFPVVFYRHDGILSCPANTRFLPLSRQVCTRSPGLTCLCVDRKEGCLKELSFIQKIGRITLRVSDLKRIKSFKYFVANSHYIRKIHQLDRAIIQIPSLRQVPETNLNDIKKDAHQILFVGRLTLTKGPKDALRILQFLPSYYKLVIVGDGPLLSTLQEFCVANNLSERVRFTGWLTLNDVYSEMRKSGVSIVPSLWDEAFGLVGVESFICGTPVVAYDVGGISEWCKPPCGITVPCGHYEEAAQSILRISGDKESWNKLCEQCVIYAKKNFSQKNFNRQLEDFLEAVVTDQKSRHFFS